MVPDAQSPVDFEAEDLTRLAVVEGDRVVNVIMAPDGYADPLGRELVPAPHGKGPEIGWQRVNGEWTNPEADDEA